MRSPIVKPGLIIALLCVTAAARAQSLPDPTRPPAEFTVAAPGQARAASATPQLQSILIGRGAGGRRVAVIDGQTVQQGGQFRGARVARIAPNEVELIRDGGSQVLRLYPRPPAQSFIQK